MPRPFKGSDGFLCQLLPDLFSEEVKIEKKRTEVTATEISNRMEMRYKLENEILNRIKVHSELENETSCRIKIPSQLENNISGCTVHWGKIDFFVSLANAIAPEGQNALIREFRELFFKFYRPGPLGGTMGRFKQSTNFEEFMEVALSHAQEEPDSATAKALIEVVEFVLFDDPEALLLTLPSILVRVIDCSTWPDDQTTDEVDGRLLRASSVIARHIIILSYVEEKIKFLKQFTKIVNVSKRKVWPDYRDRLITRIFDHLEEYPNIYLELAEKIVEYMSPEDFRSAFFRYYDEETSISTSRPMKFYKSQFVKEMVDSPPVQVLLYLSLSSGVIKLSDKQIAKFNEPLVLFSDSSIGVFRSTNENKKISHFRVFVLTAARLDFTSSISRALTKVIKQIVKNGEFNNEVVSIEQLTQTILNSLYIKKGKLPTVLNEFTGKKEKEEEKEEEKETEQVSEDEYCSDDSVNSFKQGAAKMNFFTTSSSVASFFDEEKENDNKL